MSHKVWLSNAKSKSWNMVALNSMLIIPLTVISEMNALTFKDPDSLLSEGIVAFSVLVKLGSTTLPTLLLLKMLID